MSFGSMVVKSPKTFLCDTFASARHHSEVAVHPGRSRWDRCNKLMYFRESCKKLNLAPIQRATVLGVHGPEEVNVYFITNILSNENIKIKVPLIL